MISCSHWGMFVDPLIQRAVAGINSEMKGLFGSPLLTEDAMLDMRRSGEPFR